MTCSVHSGSSSAAVPMLTRCAPVAERGLEARVVADAAGQLDPHVLHAVDHGLDDLEVAAAAERGVEVDEVDPGRALIRPVARGGDRVAVPGLAARLPLHEPDGLPAGHIDGGQQHEGGRCITERGRVRMAGSQCLGSPASW